ncbi:hypothetical protein MF1_08580 [Bartonella quintana]|nr:hypothetical protein MF1_08580 [Bartonella quintana]
MMTSAAWAIEIEINEKIDVVIKYFVAIIAPLETYITNMVSYFFQKIYSKNDTVIRKITSSLENSNTF